MDSFDASTWDFLDYSFLDDVSSCDLSWVNQSVVEIDFSQNDSEPAHQASLGKECSRKRGRHSCSKQGDSCSKQGDSCCKQGTKACREKMRRDKLNESFEDLSAVLELGKTARADKWAILAEAVRALNRLRSEAQEFKDEHEKLQEEMNALKAEKIELLEEKKRLKAEKEKMALQLKTIGASGFISPHPMVYQHSEMSKMTLLPSYGMYPMWHYLPPATRDVSHDHELRPPAA